MTDCSSFSVPQSKYDISLQAEFVGPFQFMAGQPTPPNVTPPPEIAGLIKPLFLGAYIRGGLVTFNFPGVFQLPMRGFFL